MKIKYKIMVTVILIILTITVISNVTFATTLSDLDAPASNIFNKFGNSTITLISTVGMVLSVIVLIILGIKYMIGSLEDRAEYKRTMLPYLIGAGLVFGGSAIAQIIYNIANSL